MALGAAAVAAAAAWRHLSGFTTSLDSCEAAIDGGRGGPFGGGGAAGVFSLMVLVGAVDCSALSREAAAGFNRRSDIMEPDFAHRFDVILT